MAIAASSSRSFDRSAEAATLAAREDRAAAEGANSTLGALLGRVSPLDRLLADAGPLGKFRADRNYTLPAGTSALTVRIADAIDHAAATIGRPAERMYGAAPIGPAAIVPARAIDPSAVPADHTHAASSVANVRIVDPRPAVMTDACSPPSHDAPRNQPGRDA
ncbi:hypothetical protein U1872_03730 [Sphingomonas sp. RB3P16]|uniref:hypothetical protein n=1 Tax=Parasphingomonas frigoris TaxID=3096163 RepID=UPI002FC632F6